MLTASKSCCKYTISEVSGLSISYPLFVPFLFLFVPTVLFVCFLVISVCLFGCLARVRVILGCIACFVLPT